MGKESRGEMRQKKSNCSEQGNCCDIHTGLKAQISRSRSLSITSVCAGRQNNQRNPDKGIPKLFKIDTCAPGEDQKCPRQDGREQFCFVLLRFYKCSPGTHCVDLTEKNLRDCLLLPSECWDHTCELPLPARMLLKTVLRWRGVWITPIQDKLGPPSGDVCLPSTHLQLGRCPQTYMDGKKGKKKNCCNHTPNSKSLS